MPNPSFAAAQTNPFSLTDVGDSSTPTFADIDNDNDLDAFVGAGNGNIYYFQNTGTASSPSFAAAQTNPFNLTVVGDYSKPTFADIDNDNDLDAFVGADNGNIYYFQNTGTASSPSFAAAQTNPFNLTDVGFYSAPTFADIDNDNDLDAFVGEYFGNTYYFQNTGTASSPSFAAAQTNPFNLTGVGNTSAPTFADIDNDNDLDAFVGASNGNTHYFQNTGTASSPSFAAAQTNPFNLTDVGDSSTPTFADIDNDNDLDAFVGEYFGNTYYFQNGPTNGAPTALALSSTSINENVDPNSTVGTLTTTDPDTGDTFTYSLVSGTGDTDNTAFTIVDNQLQIKASPDFETKSSYSIRVKTTDAGGLSFEKELTININDIDEFVSLTPNNDLFNGTAGADQANGGAGSDILYGKAGNDILDGGDGNDILYGGDDDDLLKGGNGSDRLYGDGGHDQLYGDAGNDILYGGDGDNLLDGGLGSDQLYGNTGIDTFVLASGMGQDSIYKFEDGKDKIRLDAGLTFADLKITQSGTNTLIKVLASGVTLASLTNVSSTLIGSADFL
ncbi:calcium-binding protein [Planktothrix mougeotii]|uniref:VCBS repeat-containing protein n=1 Tax=Planktothrix mougeotii LEGE 06226 TaxID=1828728 RepID=A0ABR9UKA3_9CYAN|nr:FG-GAP-like repeat-containing protein [Planktothrix mougeotii]MBE9146206.1 VCBS repeat-containing protein [Planktothrix mougeotii LEGE 06226]